MVDFHRLKTLGTDIIGRAGDIAEQAKDKVGPLAEQAKDKVVPLAGKAKDVAAKGVDKAAGGLDSATGHKYHDKLGAVAGNREKSSGGPADLAAPLNESVPDDVDAGPATDAAVPPEVVDQAGAEPPAVVSTPRDVIDPPGAPTIEEPTEDDTADRPPTPADMPAHRPADETTT